MKFDKCPNKKCVHAKGTTERFFIKRGYFKTKWNAQPVPRYQCRACKKTFSSHTFLVTYQQKKPYLNQEVFKWYSSGNTQRRMAIIMGITRRTVIRKFLFMAWQARLAHSQRIASGELKTSWVHFDEMETFEHTRLKPLSIALAVRAKTGEIIDAQVAQMNCKGHLASISQMKYGWRKDNRDIAREDTLKTVNACSRRNILIVTDKKTDYPAVVAKWVPNAEIKQVKRVEKPAKGMMFVKRRNAEDALFTLNYTAAKIRHDLSRMARKSWVTTKKMERLQAHLDLYIAYNNGYTIAA